MFFLNKKKYKSTQNTVSRYCKSDITASLGIPGVQLRVAQHLSLFLLWPQETLVLRGAPSAINQPTSTSVSADNWLCLAVILMSNAAWCRLVWQHTQMSLAWKGTPGRWSPEASVEKKVRTLCVTKRCGSARTEAPLMWRISRALSREACMERMKRDQISLTSAYRWAHQQGLPPPLPLLTERWMDSHIPNNRMGRFKILISSMKYWSAVHGPQMRAMGCFPSGLYDLLCLKPSPNKLNQNPFCLCWRGLKTEGRGGFTRSSLLPRQRVSHCQGSPVVAHVPG